MPGPPELTWIVAPAGTDISCRPDVSTALKAPLALTCAAIGWPEPPDPNTATRSGLGGCGGLAITTGMAGGGVRAAGAPPVEAAGVGTTSEAAAAAAAACCWRYSSPSRPSITSLPCSSMRARWKYCTRKPARWNGSDVG